jgi:L-iditol 2-dehydrogenase
MRMRAAFMPEPGRIEVGEFPIPSIAADEVLVRMHRASICGSDLHVVYHGFHAERGIGHPGYPGHEGVGEIVESRSDRFAAGQRVLTAPVGHFGRCFGEYQAIPARQVVALPAGDPARLVLGQQLGTTIYAMKKFWPSTAGAGRVAAVIGAGSAGLFFVQHLRRLGFDRIIVSDLDPHRLAVAARLGADEVVTAPDTAMSAAVAAATGGRGADLVIEAVGLDALRADAIEAIAVRGTAGFFGYPERHGLAPFPAFTAFRKSAVVEWVCDAQSEPGLASFVTALTMIDDGSIEVDYCTDVSMPLEEIAAAFERAADRGRGAVKIGITL